jgi:hypothetical protein
MKEIEFDLPLEIDDQSLTERAAQNVLIDESIKILARKNRLGISVKPLQQTEFPAEDKKFADLKIVCLAHADPECEFKWVTFTAGFSKMQGVIIKDMSPRKVVGNPVKMTTTYKSGANFDVEIAPVAAGVSIGRDQQAEREVYFPEITGSGVGFSHAQWDFKAGDQADLHVDRDLRLLLEYPYLTKFISVKFTIRAEVSVKGLLSYIPLVGKRESEFEVTATF